MIVAAIAKKNPRVPLQLYDRRQYGANIPWHHAFLWGYAQDNSRLPSFVVVPTSDDDMILLRVTDCKEYPVTASMDTPFRPLPGMYFFDAWRITPCQAQRIVASDTRSDESPLEQAASEEESSAWVRPTMPKKTAEVAPDQHVYELS